MVPFYVPEILQIIKELPSTNIFEKIKKLYRRAWISQDVE